MRGRYAFVVLALLSVLTAGAALLSAVGYYHDSQAAQQRQGQQIEAKLCSTLDALASLKPPAGNPAANPARGYDQTLHAALAQLGPDIGCDRR